MKRSSLILISAAIILIAVFFMRARRPANEAAPRPFVNEPRSAPEPTTVSEPNALPPVTLAPPLDGEPGTKGSSAQKKLAILQEILKSRNDNDPRLDSEFRNLTPEDKAALRGFYAQLPTEDRNGRGTVVFLIGREMNSRQDTEFLKTVLQEAPCLSLENCAQAAGGDPHEDLENINDVTRSYPQMAALNRIENWLGTPATKGLPNDPSVLQGALSALVAAKRSHSKIVADKAAELIRQIQAKNP